MRDGRQIKMDQEVTLGDTLDTQHFPNFCVVVVCGLYSNSVTTLTVCRRPQQIPPVWFLGDDRKEGRVNFNPYFP